MKKHFEFPNDYKHIEIGYCPDCKIYQLTPMLGKFDYDLLYSDKYFSTENEHFYEISREDRVRVYEQKIKRLKLISPNAKSLLDIGAGEGDFIRIAKEYYTTYAVEYSQHGFEAICNIDNVIVKKGSADCIMEFNEDFDIIFMHHVFEHITNPNYFIQCLRQKMHRNSIFMFEIPNQFNSFLFNLRKYVGLPEIYKGLFSLHHPFMYTKEGIRKLLKDNDFEILSLTTAPPERAICSYDNMIKLLARKYIAYPIQKGFENGSVIEVICKKQN